MKRSDKLVILLDGPERALDAARCAASVKSFNASSVVVLFNVFAHLPQSYPDLDLYGIPDPVSGSRMP